MVEAVPDVPRVVRQSENAVFAQDVRKGDSSACVFGVLHNGGCILRQCDGYSGVYWDGNCYLLRVLIMDYQFAYIGDPMLVQVTITDSTSETAVTGATVTFTVKDADGAVVGTADHSMPHVSDGLYRGTWPDDESADMEENLNYYVWITADNYTRRRLTLLAKYREIH